MGNKKHQHETKKKEDFMYDKFLLEDAAAGGSSHHMCAKQLSKRRRKQLKKQQILVAKKHRWHLIKVYDTKAPSKAFLEESFKNFVENEFVMLGFHQSAMSSRFYLENDSGSAIAILALHKRMQGCDGRIMGIQMNTMQAGDDFTLLNANQLTIVKQTLEQRYNASDGVLDLTSFHLDPLLLTHNVLPVLSDATLCRQVFILIRDNIPQLKGINLSRNALKLTSITVFARTLSACPLTHVNLEFNDFDNVKDLTTVLSVFPLIELRIEGNSCLKDVKNPQIYIKMVTSKLTHLKMLDNVNILNYLAEKGDASQPTPELNALTSTPASLLTEAGLKTFLEQYYTCIDSAEQRLQLVQAYTPDAKLEIQSSIAVVCSGIAQGHEAIGAALTALPATKHAGQTFSLNIIKVEAAVGQVEVTGQLQLQGYDEVVSFVHSFNIVPYHSGLGCSIGLLVFK